MRTVLNQLLGLLLLAAPVAAVRWNPAGRGAPDRGRSRLAPPARETTRWRVEIRSSDPVVAPDRFDGSGAPFPVRPAGDDAEPDPDLPDDRAWTRPRVVLEVETEDPLSDDALRGLLGDDHRVRFETADEVVVDRGRSRLRLRATRVP